LQPPASICFFIENFVYTFVVALINIYYKAADVKEFVYRNGDYWDKKAFANATQPTDE
jgi:hypothetical protein